MLRTYMPILCSLMLIRRQRVLWTLGLSVNTVIDTFNDELFGFLGKKREKKKER